MPVFVQIVQRQWYQFVYLIIHRFYKSHVGNSRSYQSLKILNDCFADELFQSKLLNPLMVAAPLGYTKLNLLEKHWVSLMLFPMSSLQIYHCPNTRQPICLFGLKRLRLLYVNLLLTPEV